MGELILECILKNEWGCVNWIDLAQDRDRWGVVGTVVKPGYL